MTTKTAPQLSDLLIERISTIAAKYGPLADDVRGHVTLVMLEQMQDKHFAEQQPGYHIKRAKWEAQKYVHSLTIYTKYVACEDELMRPDEGDSDSSAVSFFDEYASSQEAGVECQVIANEFFNAVEAAIEALPEQQRRVARLRLAGYDLNEIAQKLGLNSKGGVSDLTHRAYTNMQKSLAQYL